MSNLIEGFVIENPTLIREQVYDTIKNALLAGHIRAGSRLIEGRLAKQINVSRTPVREALHLLEMEGFLESFPRIGYRVRRITWKEVEEICEIRAAVEPLAAKKAIAQTDQHYLHKLETNISQAEIKLKTEDLASFIKHDAEFDEIIMNASGMDTLIEIWATLRRRMILYRIESHFLSSSWNRTIEAHRRIFECLKAKNADCAEKAIQDHLEQVKQDIREYAFEDKKRGL